MEAFPEEGAGDWHKPAAAQKRVEMAIASRGFTQIDIAIGVPNRMPQFQGFWRDRCPIWDR